MNITLFNIPFFGKSKQILAVNSKNEVKEYKTQKEAAKDLDVQQSNISAVINGKCHTIKGYAFVRADESLDAIGRQKLIDDARQRANESSFYAIDTEGNSKKYKKYSSQRIAAKDLGIHHKDICLALASKRRTVGKYLFIPAKDIEITNENDNSVVVDEEKLAKIIDKIKSKDRKTMYIISPDGTYKKYYSQTETANALGIFRQNVCAALSGGRNIFSNHMIVSADEIETRDDDGNLIVDEKKVKELILKKERSIKSKPIYVINSDGSYKKYANQKEACTDTGYTQSKINSILNKKRKNIDGKTFAYSYELESLNENGDLVLNQKIIDELRKTANSSSIYAINSNGEYKKFIKRKDAVRELGIKEYQIFISLNENKPVNNVLFVHANDLESSDELGKIFIDRTTLLDCLKIANKESVYAVNISDGAYKKYNSVASASEELKIKEDNIHHVLKGRTNKTQGYKFIYANLVDYIDETGHLVPDTDLMYQMLNIN